MGHLDAGVGPARICGFERILEPAHDPSI